MTTITAAPVSGTLAFLPLHFPLGIPGFDECQRFTLVGVDDLPLYLLRCDDAPGIALPVAQACAIAEGYAFELSEADATAVGVTRPEEVEVFVVLTVSATDRSVTANLLAPIVVNRRTRQARQLILDPSSHSLRHPVTAINEIE